MPIEKRLRGIALNNRSSLGNLRILLLDIGDSIILHLNVLDECFDICNKLPCNTGKCLVDIEIIGGTGNTFLLL